MRISVSATLFAASLLTSTLASAAPPVHYRLAEFGADDSETQFTSVNGVNDLGEATVSISQFGPGQASGQAYVWHDGQMTPITGLDSVCGAGSSSSAGGLNDRGQVIVGVSNSNGCVQSVVWQGGKVLQVIGPPPAGYTVVAAGGLNDFGRVIGTVFGNNGVDTEFVWHNGKFTLLPVLPGGATGGPGGGEAAAINEFGVVVGTSGSTDGLRAVLWRNGAVQNLGVCPGFGNSGAGGINNLGEIVGGCQNNEFAPFIWRNGQLTLLPIPATGSQSVLASGINDFGQIVGAEEPASGDPTQAGSALLWQGGVVYDLNTLIAPDDPLKPYVRLLQAGQITNTGFILANGEDSRVPNNFAIQFVLIPVH